MTELQRILAQLGYPEYQLPAVVSRRKPEVVVLKPAEPQVNQEHAGIFQNYRPNYWTAVGLRTANLDKVSVWEKNGRTYAYYSLSFYDPTVKSSCRMAWRYKVADGCAVEDKAFPVTYR